MDIFFNIDEHILEPYKKALSKRWNYVLGSRGSGKSTFAVACVIYKMLLGNSILVLRNRGRSHKDSTYSEIVNKLEELKIPYKAVSAPVCRIQVGKSVVLFGGMDNAEKIKSLKPLKSNPVGLIWIEETTEIYDKMNYKEAIEQINKIKFTFGRSINDKPIKVLMTYNPDKPGHWLQEKEEERGFDETIEHFTRTTFEDNPYLTEEFIGELQNYKDTWPEYYEQIALGKWMNLGDIVYNMKENNILKENNKYHQINIGVDLGDHDSTTFVAVGFTNGYNTIDVIENYSWDNRKAAYAKDRSDFAEDLVEFCEKIASKYNCSYIKLNCETAGYGNPFMDIVEKMLWSRSLPIKVNKARKVLIANRILLVNLLLTSNRLKIREDSVLWKEMKSSRYWKGKREDKNDHSINAFEYALESESEYISIGGI